MTVVIITCMIYAFALTMGGRATQSEITGHIGGDVTLHCPLVPDDLWTWVYWKKNDLTIYSLEVESNTPWTNDPRYEGSNHATGLTIKDLKKTDSGIYHCKVATLVFIKERGQVLLSVTDQEVGLSTTSPGVQFRASTTIPPQPAEVNKIFLVFLILFPIIIIIIIILRLAVKYRERYRNLRAEFESASQKIPASISSSTPLAPDSSHREIRDKEGTRTDLFSSDTDGRDDVYVQMHLSQGRRSWADGWVGRNSYPPSIRPWKY